MRSPKLPRILHPFHFLQATQAMTEQQGQTAQERKAALVEWFTFFGSLVDLQCPTDQSNHSMKQFYKKLVLRLHPDKQSAADPRHKHRAEYFFKILSDVFDTYFNTENNVKPPDRENSSTSDDLPHDTAVPDL